MKSVSHYFHYTEELLNLENLIVTCYQNIKCGGKGLNLNVTNPICANE
jgi:hypothetical protein